MSGASASASARIKTLAIHWINCHLQYRVYSILLFTVVFLPSL